VEKSRERLSGSNGIKKNGNCKREKGKGKKRNYGLPEFDSKKSYWGIDTYTQGGSFYPRGLATKTETHQ